MAEDDEDFFRSSAVGNEGAEVPSPEDIFGSESPATPGAVSQTVTQADEEDPGHAADRLSTGIEELDRALDGGVPHGRLVALVTSPGVQSKLLLQRLLAQRETLYITTDSPEWEVRKDIDPEVGVGDVVIKEYSPEELLSSQADVLEEMAPESNLVIDSVNELELVSRERYRSFLSTIKRVLYETGSMGVLYGVSVDHESARDMTLRRADIVWRLETTIADAEIENRLYVPKFKGGAAMTDAVKLLLTDEVRVDTSRDIA